MRRQPAKTTMADLRQGADWFWVYCEAQGCHHRAPMKAETAIQKYGPDASTDVLRDNAVCSKCGHKGATLMMPSWVSTQVGYAPWPGNSSKS